ncbi:hypothetical protein FF38_02023 [Lucilia cuprina]|uniref:Uncharacterized protein n=1 Tax=Lucilia cuprina TaxID=7375 RepID=A0A0L0BP78_LUCCU|nr:hypothetical protein FF38_02023 [Lucilia cuprina]
MTNGRYRTRHQCIKRCARDKETFIRIRYLEKEQDITEEQLWPLEKYNWRLEFDREGLTKLKKAVKAIHNSGNSKFSNKFLIYT